MRAPVDTPRKNHSWARQRRGFEADPHICCKGPHDDGADRRLRRDRRRYLPQLRRARDLAATSRGGIPPRDNLAAPVSIVLASSRACMGSSATSPVHKRFLEWYVSRLTLAHLKA